MVKLSITTRINAETWHWLDKESKQQNKSKAIILEELIKKVRVGF